MPFRAVARRWLAPVTTSRKITLIKVAVFLLLLSYVFATCIVHFIVSKTIDESVPLFNKSEWQLPSFSSRRHPRKFFPTYGTAEFDDMCGWTQHPAEHRQRNDCTFIARPSPDSTEGISQWICQIVTAFILSRQSGCKLLLDYGPEVEIDYVLAPIPENPIDQWTVPAGFHCEEQKNCFIIDKWMYINVELMNRIRTSLGRKLSRGPFYRHAYESYFKLDPTDNVTVDLPGYELDSGFACAIGNLFHLQPSASQFEAQLFTKILPALHADDALVMSLYIRTMYSENITKPDMFNMSSPAAKQVVQCALKLEQDQLKSERSFSRIVWMLVTDSPQLRKIIVDAYDGQPVNNITGTSTSDKSKSPVQRKVMVTSSRGAHTRFLETPAREHTPKSPLTADFSEALIDWYLIGESDLVIKNQWTFGATASLRTKRPMYHATPKTCSLQDFYNF